MKRPDFGTIYMRLAHMMAERSTCARLKVGAVITSPDYRKVISLGYNGGASGQENECESLVPGICGHLHAEENAIINCDVPRTTGKIVFVTHLPCPMCAKRLVNLGGVQKVYFREDYRVRDAATILAKANIPLIEMPA